MGGVTDFNTYVHISIIYHKIGRLESSPSRLIEDVLRSNLDWFRSVRFPSASFGKVGCSFGITLQAAHI